jgi:hypothetical protein
MPQNQAVFARVLIVVSPYTLNSKSQTLIQGACRRVRLPHLERGHARALGDGIAHHLVEEPACDALPPDTFIDGQAVDVQLIEDDPARTVGDQISRGRPRDIDPRHIRVLELPLDGLRAPAVGETAALQRRDLGQVVGRRRATDTNVCARSGWAICAGSRSCKLCHRGGGRTTAAAHEESRPAPCAAPQS